MGRGVEGVTKLIYLPKMNSNHWHPAFRWSESLKAYEMLAIFRYELDAKEWERGPGPHRSASSRSDGSELRDSKWARKLFGYQSKTSSAFWQFVYSNGVPHIRLNRRRIMFSELAVRDWIAKRSVGGPR